MSRRVRPRYIVDASVAMKWYLPDEDYATESDTLLTAYSLGQVVLMAPQHIYYEVSNALCELRFIVAA